jgi:putative DNA primase/helicase
MTPLDLHTIARQLGGEVSNGQINCPGPGHSSKDRSLSVRFTGNGFLTHSFAGDDPLKCRDHVKERLGWREPERRAAPKPSQPLVLPAKGTLEIWGQGVDPRGTLAERYLASRKLVIPTEAAVEALRFHPNCWFGKEKFPALIALIRNIKTNEPQGIQRTALHLDGAAVKRNGKTFRMTLGPMGGGAIKIDPDEHVTQGLCVGEGLESTLAGRQSGYVPAWSLLNANGLEKFPVLPGIEGLTIFVDKDEAGIRAMNECGNRWYEQGIEVHIVEPPIGNDLNDYAQCGGQQ